VRALNDFSGQRYYRVGKHIEFSIKRMNENSIITRQAIVNERVFELIFIVYDDVSEQSA